jgi:ABC-type oligopeptide transport system substrate-binding subunit
MSQLRLALVIIVGLLVSPGMAQAGGTFRYSLDTDIDYVDPALAYYGPTWEIEYATCSMLVNYPDAPAPRGARLVPDGAATMPTVSADGKTYTFRIRDGRKFSNGRRIDARHYAYALNRSLSKVMSSPAQHFYEDIVGAKDVIVGKVPNVTGIEVLPGNRLRIRLTKPAPDILARLAMPFACAIPLSLTLNPDGTQAPVVGSGPYYVAEWVPKRRVVLRRNRHYSGPRPHNVNEVVYDIGQPLATIRLRIESGQTDHGPVPAAAHAELGPRHGVHRRSPGRYFVNPIGAIRYLALNHERELFGKPGGGPQAGLGNVRLKQAVNFAIDRTSMIRQRGAYAGVINDQYLPPVVRGYRNAAIYPARPNVGRARALAAGATRSGKALMYTCNSGACIATAQIVQQNLRAIGLAVDIKVAPRACQFFCYRRFRGDPFDLSLESWRMDYLDPADFLFLLDGRTIALADNSNLSYFNSVRYNRKLDAASRLVGDVRDRALGALDVDLARNVAPLASFMSDTDRRFFSSRARNFFQHPVYGLDLPAIAVE